MTVEDKIKAIDIRNELLRARRGKQNGAIIRKLDRKRRALVLQREKPSITEA